MPWIKVYTEFVDDAKFASCTDSAKLRFIQLMLIAGECDADGDLVAGGEWLKLDQLAWRLRVMHDQLETDVQTLIALGVIARTKQGLTIVNFDKRQGRPQSVKREQWRARQQRHRTVTRDSRVSNAGVTLTDKDKERDKDKDKDTASSSFNNNSGCASRAVVVAESNADEARKAKLSLLGIKKPTLDKLARELHDVSREQFEATWNRVWGEKLAHTSGHPDALKINNWAGYAVSVFRELAGVTR